MSTDIMSETMTDSNSDIPRADLPAKSPPKDDRLFDPWEEEFRKSYRNGDKEFEF